MNGFRGDPWDHADLFPGGLVADVLQLVIDTWASFKKPKDTELEPAITERFAKAMDSRNRHAGAIPTVLIDWEVDAAGAAPGRIDIRLIRGKRRDVYFGIEAKKLNRPNTDNAAAYVGKDGMGRFVSDKYGPNQEHGGMIGYVMDGRCDTAVAKVRERMDKRRKELMLAGSKHVLRQSRKLPKHKHAYESEHELANRVMTLHHLMLAA